jgi:hypothetical protein
MTDEGCAAGCVVVCGSCAGSGPDGTPADGSLERPFATLEAAIAAVGQGVGDGRASHRICVAGGTSCSEAWTYKSAARISIDDGFIVQGSYAVTPAGLVYCDASPKPRTTLEFSSNLGVVFDERVVIGAELGGFEVSISGVAANEPTDPTIAIAVVGARNVSLGRVFISGGLAGAETYGVSITAGGQATIIGSAISTGQGQASAIGVYVNGGTVNLRHNCDDLVAGSCMSRCSDCGPLLGIRGYVAEDVLGAPAQSSGIYITGGAGSSVVGNMVCGGSSRVAGGGSVVMGAAVLCDGPGCSTVSGNRIIGGNDRDTIGLALVGANPRVDGNHVEGGCGARSTTGIWLESSSARLQNNRILGGQCPGTDLPVFYGLRAKIDGTAADPDVHSNDIEPLGQAANCQSVGVFLESSSGLGTSTGGTFRNNIISAGQCARRAAVREAPGAALRVLAHNDLYDPTTQPLTGSLVLYQRGAGDASTAAQVNAQPNATDNISADPRYAAYLSDFHLTAESACIDQGIADGAPATDADEKQRPEGAGYDLGAYEFQRSIAKD